MRRARATLLLPLLLLPLLTPPLLVLGLFGHLADAQTPPKFLRTPNDQTGVQGGVASFVCQATGDPRPKIVWNKKGKKVSNQRFEVIEFDDGSGSVLRIQPLRTPRDEAIYECVASNSVGETSATTRLTVLREDQLPPGFPTIDMGPQLKVVERTRTATMLCAASGNPDPDISWFKDFLPVNTTTNNGRIKQLRSGALQIEQSEESDQGKYECVATNNDGTRYSSPANLYVRVRRVPPRFSIPPTDNEIMPGGSVNITCVAVGSPMPYVKWMLGAEDLTPEDDMPIGRNVLELTDVRQSANYTCVAMSTLGVIEAMAQITVKALPKAPGTPVVTEHTATSITLTWDSGNPEPVSYYIIQHKSKYSDDLYKEIDGVATTRYSVGGLSPYSDYEFRVVAVNNIGRGPPSEAIEAKTAEQAPSTAPRQVRGHMMSSTTAVIHWDEPEEANGQIMGYRVYYTLDSSQHVNLWEKRNVRGANFVTIPGLVPDRTYYIKVLAYTSVGDGPLSPDLQIITKIGVPSQPTDFKAEAKSETSILLSWIAPAQTGQENQITGYDLVYRKSDDKEEKRISFEPTTTYLLKELKPFTTYTFRLAVRSKHGAGAYSNEISAETPQTRGSVCIRASARSCGECVRVSESCGWCSDPSFLTESIFGRCDDLESLKTRNCSAGSIQNPRGRVEITRNQPTGKEPGKQPEQIIRIQPQELTLTLRPGEPQSFQLKFHHVEDESQSSSSSLSSLSSQVVLENSKLPEGVSINYKSICKNGVEATGDSGRRCSNVFIGDKVLFQISVQADTCPADGRSESIKIKPLGFTEEVEIVLNFVCDCPCAEDGQPQSSQCFHGNGTFECGACKCNPGRVGRVCECSTDEVYAEDLDAACRRDDGTDVCSNNGDCVCGTCECKKRENPAERYSGRFCECDNFNCDRANNMLCGGHGRCECRQCICDPKYTGSACDCSLDVSTCMAKNGQICNGRGVCECGSCKCTDPKFQGPTCEICPTCPGVCTEHKDCVLCRAFSPGQSCQHCNYFDLIKVAGRDQLPQPHDDSGPVAHCKERDEDDCWFYYSISIKSQTKVVHVAGKECPSPFLFGRS